MTLREAMQYRGLTAGQLARLIGVGKVTVECWQRDDMDRVTLHRLQQLAKMLDGGVLITEDGVELELYGGKG